MPGPYRRVPGEEVRATLGGPAAAAAPSSGNSSAAASLAGGAGTSDGGVGQPTRTPSERLLDKAYARELLIRANVNGCLFRGASVLASVVVYSSARSSNTTHFLNLIRHPTQSYGL